MLGFLCALAAGAALIALGIAFKTVAFIVGALSTAFTVLKVAVLAPMRGGAESLNAAVAAGIMMYDLTR